MNYMFCGFEKLSSLLDISIWNTKSINYMNCMFKNCKSLSSLFDTKKWKIKKNTEKNDIFDGCLLLEKNNKFDDNYKYEMIFIDFIEI